jgi:hypothetical protein
MGRDLNLEGEDGTALKRNAVLTVLSDHNRRGVGARDILDLHDQFCQLGRRAQRRNENLSTDRSPQIVAHSV